MDKKRTACIAGAFLAGAVIGGGATCGVFLHKDSVRVEAEKAEANSIHPVFHADIKAGVLTNEFYMCGKESRSAQVNFDINAGSAGTVKAIDGLNIVYEGKVDKDGLGAAMSVAEKFCKDGSFEKPKAPKL
jgi:hypothetical protein